MQQASGAGLQARLWAPATGLFSALFTNVLLNVIVLTGLALGVVQLPEDIVFGRILPALGIALPIGNLYYAYLAWRLARREGRGDVTAMPYGPSVPHVFIVVFLIMLPIYLKTNDPILAWQAGLAWALHHRRDRAAGRRRPPDHPPVHAARRDVGHAGRDLDRVHLDAPGLPDVGSALDCPGCVRHHPDQLDGATSGCRAGCRAASRR